MVVQNPNTKQPITRTMILHAWYVFFLCIDKLPPIISAYATTIAIGFRCMHIGIIDSLPSGSKIGIIHKKFLYVCAICGLNFQVFFVILKVITEERMLSLWCKRIQTYETVFSYAQKSVPALLLILSMLLTPGLGLLPLRAGEASLSDESEETEGSYDFEFKTAASIEGFAADSGEVAWRDGKPVYTLSGTDSRLVSPAISVEPGDVYAARLPLRNTLFVRLKNSTSATQMRISYTTTESRDYSEDKSAVFEVRPHSDYTSYFFNLSDCPTVAEGYLYGFAVEPIGATAGTMEIGAVIFEREAATIPAVGTLTSCTAASDTITITGLPVLWNGLTAAKPLPSMKQPSKTTANNSRNPRSSPK